MAKVKTRGLAGLFHACAFTWLLTTGCGKQALAPANASPPEVDVTPVVRKNVPIIQEWVANVDGFVNAQIQPQVSGYLLKQSYREGSFVEKGQALFEIDARPFQAAAQQAQAQLAEARAQKAKAQEDVNRDGPLAEARAIAQKQFDADKQALLAAQAASPAISSGTRYLWSSPLGSGLHCRLSSMILSGPSMGLPSWQNPKSFTAPLIRYAWPTWTWSVFTML